MRESEIEAYLVSECHKVGAEVRKLKFIGRRGAPDRLVMHNAKTIFIELKSPGKKLKAHQEREIQKMRKVGQLVLVIDSKQLVEGFILNLVNDVI